MKVEKDDKEALREYEKEKATRQWEPDLRY